MGTWVQDKDVRSYVAASMFLMLVLLLVAYLTFIPVPATNKDLITSIIATIAGGIAVSLNKLLGRADDEVDKLRAAHDKELSVMRMQLAVLQAKYDVLKDDHDATTKRMINHLARVGNDRFNGTQFEDTRPIDNKRRGL